MNQQLLELYKEVAEDLEVDVATVNHVFNYIVNDIRRQIGTGLTKEIMIHNFGTFKIPDNSIKKFKQKVESAYKQGLMTQSKFKKNMRNLEMIEKRSEEKKD
jgi:nucleoid DNA-binding protein